MKEMLLMMMVMVDDDEYDDGDGWNVKERVMMKDGLLDYDHVVMLIMVMTLLMMMNMMIDG